jgi:hypothetical protein
MLVAILVAAQDAIHHLPQVMAAVQQSGEMGQTVRIGVAPEKGAVKEADMVRAGDFRHVERS